jgi:glycosyltransferase involved in cell wall biosynthesis
VTVAICTFNRARLLDPTLESLTRLNPPEGADWELLVVDNNSTDDTQAVCARFAGRLPMRAVVEKTAGLSHARNRALRETRGAHIVYTDDDVLVDQAWLSSFVDATRRFPEAAAFGGPIEPNFPVQPPPDLLAAFPILARGFCAVDHKLELGLLPAALPIWGANMAYRVAAVAGLSFDPRFGYTPNSLGGGEESRFLAEIRARGGAVVWCPGMRLKHYVDPARMTLDYLVRRYVGSGEEFVRQHGVPAGKTFLGQPRWLLRKTTEAYVSYLLARLVAARVEALTRLREYSEFRGMLRECRAAARSGSRS